MMKKIVVIGPESAGKSTLCAALAAHYGTLWVPEYAREYLWQHGAAYTYGDLLHIAKGQQALEDEYATQLAEKISLGATHSPLTTHHSPLIIDTNQYVMKVWCEVAYNNCHPWVLQQIAQRHYDLYLLCTPDLPWVPDGLREYPDPAARQKLFLVYKDLAMNDGTPWVIVSGSEEERLRMAVSAIDSLHTKD